MKPRPLSFSVTRAAALWLAPLLAGAGCTEARHLLVSQLDDGYAIDEAALAAAGLAPQFVGSDRERPQLPLSLQPVAEGFTQPTDIQFFGAEMLVAEKSGALWWVRGEARGEVLRLAPLTASEQGLLGVALHPSFAENGKIYLHYSAESGGGEVSRIASWTLTPGAPPSEADATPGEVLLEIPQPYPNHNAGQLAFGPDGRLYVALGDGGYRNDPHGHGQDTSTLLGAMLRIDVDAPSGGRAYGIPSDNPLVGIDGARPEIWAWGLRNPWRFSFAPDGRMVIADVGQNRFEEISIAAAGDNLGWNTREAGHCFAPEEGCAPEGLVDPIYEYPHEEGQSITGGFVYTGAQIPALSGRYVFGDFLSGRLWAIDLPAQGGQPAGQATALGKWVFLPSTFGRDAAGEIYVADFNSGTIYRLGAGA